MTNQNNIIKPYDRPWGSAHPGCIIFLLDQSGSMEDKFGRKQPGADQRKSDVLATVLNKCLDDLIEANRETHQDGSTEIKPRADIAVLGYRGETVTSALSGNLNNKDFVTLPDLDRNPLQIETRTSVDVDPIGKLFERTVKFRVWVKAIQGGGTPMCAALRRAHELAKQWASNHLGSYPPVVINVTDGMATDGDPYHQLVNSVKSALIMAKPCSIMFI